MRASVLMPEHAVRDGHQVGIRDMLALVAQHFDLLGDLVELLDGGAQAEFPGAPCSTPCPARVFAQDDLALAAYRFRRDGLVGHRIRHQPVGVDARLVA